MLTLAEQRGLTLKRYVRAAAAMRDLFDDTALGQAVGRTRITVGAWWRGAKPEPDAIVKLAEVTGLSADALIQFVYFDGPEPRPIGADAPEVADAIDAQAQAIRGVREEMAQAREVALEQRETTAELLGRVSAQIAELRDLLETQAGSARQDSVSQ